MVRAVLTALLLVFALLPTVAIGQDKPALPQLEGMVQAAGGEKDSFCRACFDGEYPIEIPEGAGKFVLEDQLQLPTA